MLACRHAAPIESAQPAEETTMALWDDSRDSRHPRAERSGVCMIVTVSGLIALAVALKWLIALVM